MSASSQPIINVLDQLSSLAMPPEAAATRSGVTIRVTRRIEEVETVWRQLAGTNLESPGQSYDFIRLWVKDRAIPEENQRYVVAELDGTPIALLPLHLKRKFGVRVCTWFPGAQVGCYAPVADYDRLAALGPAGRAALWRAMTLDLRACADTISLRALPDEIAGHKGLFDELGDSLTVETLYRAQFSSWEQCDKEQRSRSRRKHDRQQGDRLAALGTVAFEEITDLDAAHAAVDTMFAQRSARFRAQGIRDVFVDDGLIKFYQEALCPASGVDVRIHALRLDDDIVAVRYNIVEGDRMFCLISSMSDCERIQSGSPGKQCLLRVMQHVFDNGFTMFDMGAGYTDEKRHWCNVTVPLRQHYIGLTPQGRVIAYAHGRLQRGRAWLKVHGPVKAARKHWKTLSSRFKPQPAPTAPSDQL